MHFSSALGATSVHLDTCVCVYSQRLSMPTITWLPKRTISEQSCASCRVPRHLQSIVPLTASHYTPWQALATVCSALTYACRYASHFSESRWVVSRIGNAAEGNIACWRLGAPDGEPAGLVCNAVADWEHDEAAVDSHCHDLQRHALVYCMHVCVAQFQLDSQVRTGHPHPRLKAFLNYPWADTRPAKYLGAHTSLPLH